MATSIKTSGNSGYRCAGQLYRYAIFACAPLMLLSACGSGQPTAGGPSANRAESTESEEVVLHAGSRGYGTLEELYVHADMIIEGEVVGGGRGDPVETPDGIAVPRRVEIQIDETFHSRDGADPQTVSVTDGGWIEGATIAYEELDMMVIGEHVVLFLRADTAGDYFFQLAGPQGRYSVTAAGVEPAADAGFAVDVANMTPQQFRSALRELGSRATLADEADRAEAERNPPGVAGDPIDPGS